MSGGRGNPWELVGLLILVGLVIEWFGSGVLMALMWIGLGIYALYVLVPIFSGLARRLEWVAARIEGAQPEPKRSTSYIDQPHRDAYLAICRRDMSEIQRLVEAKGVDPFAQFPVHLQPSTCDARTLYGCAKSTNYGEAVDYFDAWRRDQSRKSLTR